MIGTGDFAASGPFAKKHSPPLSLRIIFFGTAELACASLSALNGSGFSEVVAVATQPDKPKGRDLKLQPTPVKAEALKLGLRVLQPLKARAPDFVQELAALKPDLIVVAAYGQILPQVILDLPRFGCVNVHTSLLPKYRGAAPIQWAILDGQPETGVTIMKMDAGLDTGDILAQETTSISPADDAQTLHDRLVRIGAELLMNTIPGYVEGTIPPRRQPQEGVSYARKITKEDGRLDWTRPAPVLWNRVRAFTPWPGAFTLLPDETKLPLLKVWRAEVVKDISGQPGDVLRVDRGGILVACAQEALRLLEVQREGGSRLSAQQFLAGYTLRVSQRFQ
jgi:methionyl-tRNA formyltransferase